MGQNLIVHEGSLYTTLIRIITKTLVPVGFPFLYSDDPPSFVLGDAIPLLRGILKPRNDFSKSVCQSVRLSLF